MARIFLCLFWIFNALMAILFLELFLLRNQTTEEQQLTLFALRVSSWAGGVLLIGLLVYLAPKKRIIYELFWSYNVLMAVYFLDYYFPIIPRVEDLLGFLLLMRIVLWFFGTLTLGAIAVALAKKEKRASA